MVSHRRSAKERRAQRSRAEARFIGHILRGCLELATHRGAKAGDVISALADNLRGRPPTKRERREKYQQTETECPLLLVSTATQTEDPDTTVFEDSVETGTTSCMVADDVQIEEPAPCAIQEPPVPDDFTLAANVTESWQAPRRRVRRKRNIAATIDDDDDALLNAAMVSATQERNELANAVVHQVEQLHREVHRVGLVCPRHPERHAMVARAMLDATATRCLRCNILPALGEAWASCVPCGFFFCGRCVSNYKGGAILVLLIFAVLQGQMRNMQLTNDLHLCL